MDKKQPIRRQNYAALGQPVGPYCHATSFNGMLFISGLTAYDGSGVGKPVAQQIDAIFAQIRHIAEAEGVGLDRILKVTVYIKSTEHMATVREGLNKHYQGAFPASTLLEVSRFFSPEVDIEIEAVVAL
ncbi:putative translation initiation inhibitor, yjgF family [Hahella chejuensis KCTC 2396]|uniref:Putative translation initiation inhibitor, yjgF family n=1 Tax=Hahella chejuensis (strain KCTC 2396) TaxID=349521 RepID=Q2SEF8_HAHCH|nr:RidA family protein [Hahella chejuensis]ABC30966.1 putative translation initiation inhibitor, yjgF family [Hahella chejuensis KCTC 2396]